MLSPKEVYTLSKCRDRETGASLVPHARWRQHDMRQAHTTGPEHSSSDLRRNRLPLASELPLPRDVARSYMRAKGMRANNRPRTMRMVEHGKFTFSMAPTGGVKWYEGEVLTKDGRITGGKCSCPHWKKGGVKYRGVQMCKHMIAIQMDINVGKDEEVVALVLPGGTVDDVVSEVIVNGVSKPFKGTQTEAEARLERAGFKHDKTVAYGRPGMATLHQIWRKSVERTAST